MISECCPSRGSSLYHCPLHVHIGSIIFSSLAVLYLGIFYIRIYLVHVLSKIFTAKVEHNVQVFHLKQLKVDNN